MAKHIEQQANYVQRLKTKYLSKSVLIADKNFAMLRKTSGLIEFEPFVHLMFDQSYSPDEARIAIGLLKSQTSLDNPDSCEFKIYKIANDATPWGQTLVKSGTLSIGSDRLFKTTLTQAELGDDLLGEVTIRVWAKIIKGNTGYRVQEYFNHIGITDAVLRLKKKINFLSISKKDWGT